MGHSAFRVRPAPRLTDPLFGPDPVLPPIAFSRGVALRVPQIVIRPVKGEHIMLVIPDHAGEKFNTPWRGGINKTVRHVAYRGVNVLLLLHVGELISPHPRETARTREVLVAGLTLDRFFGRRVDKRHIPPAGAWFLPAPPLRQHPV